MTILIKLVFRTFLYYLINWNYLVCDSVLLSQTEWVISTYCWLGRSALSDIRASPQLGHLAQDAAHWRPLCGVCDTALSRPVYKRVAEWLVLFLSLLLSFIYRSFVLLIVYIALSSLTCSTVDINCTDCVDCWKYLTGSRVGIVLFIRRIRGYSTHTSRHFACNEPNPEMSLHASRSITDVSKLRLAV